jgi:hypothetical protein
VIESAKFVNATGAEIILNDDEIPFRRFTTTVDMRSAERNKSQRHGIWPARSYFGRRIFSCEGDILADSSGEYWAIRQQLLNALMPRAQFGHHLAVGTLYTLFTGINEELMCECSLDGYPDIPIEAMAPARSSFLINFKAFDPKLYGDFKQTVLNMVEPGGRVYPKVYNIDYPDAVQQNESIFINSGNIETYPIVRIYGPCTDPSVTLRLSHDNYVQEVKATGLTIPDGGWVELDFSKPSVIDSNGTNLYKYFVGSEWWALEPDPVENIVTFFTPTWSAPSRAVIGWRNAYML